MIPLLLAAGRTALAAGRVSSAVSAAKGVTSALKNRGYISKAGSAARQMARAGRARQGTSSSFRNPYRFANKPGEQTDAATDMGSSVDEKTQTQSNTKKQTLIISADNVFLRTSKAIMDSVMPAAPENIERASATDEPTPEKMKDLLSPKSKTESIMLLGVLIGKVLITIVKKLKEFLDPIFKVLAKGLAVIYRGLAKVTFGGVSAAYTSAADSLDGYGESPATPDEAPVGTTPGMSPASEPTTVATDYTPAVTPSSPTSPTSPKSAYAAPSSFFGAPTLGTAKSTDTASPIFAGKTGSITNSFAEKLIKVESGGKNVANKSGVGGKPTSSAFGIAQFTKGTFETIMKNAKPGHPLYNYENKELNISKGKKTFEQFKADITFQRIALDTLTTGNIDILKSKGVAVNDATAYLAHFLGAATAAKVLAMPNDTPLSKILKQDQIAANPDVLGPKKVGTSTVERTVGDLKTWAANKMKINPDTVDISGVPPIDTMKPQSSGLSAPPTSLFDTMKPQSSGLSAAPTSLIDTMKPQSSGLSAAPQATVGSLSAPTQATGRNIETTSQILNSAPSVTTAQNSQPVVINNINAPTVASGKGSSGPAIELSLFRNIDNSILANTNRHLRVGILGV